MTYGSRDVAEMLGLSVGQVRAFVRAGFLAPERGARGEMRFSFQDLVLLRTAHGLVTANVPVRRVRLALTRLRAQLPEGRPITGVHISADGNRVVVGDGGRRWRPDSGQVLLDFDTAEIAREVVRLERRVAAEEREPERDLDAEVEALFERALALDDQGDPDGAIAAYRALLALRPAHAEARTNLGCMLHDGGRPEEAILEYLRALEIDRDSALTNFNLGVAFEDLGRVEEAVCAYERALAADDRFADAHYNLSRLHEKAGHPREALRHLKAYKQLTRK